MDRQVHTLMDMTGGGFSTRRWLTAVGFIAGLVVSGAALADMLEAEEAALNRSALRGLSGFALEDVATGASLGGYREDLGLPPASVLKSMTAAYALEALGADYRFETRLIATGPVTAGVIQGDLVLAGGGDPVFDTNGLRQLVVSLAGGGVTGVTGRFLVAEGALPVSQVIDPGQPMHVGYNPAVSGMTFNFNRVRLEWKPVDGVPEFDFTARGSGFRVTVDGIGGVLGDAPPPRHALDGAREVWTLPAKQMRAPGGLWLPVRYPALHVGEVFARLAEQAGVTLPEAEVVAEAPAGQVLAIHGSPVLTEILRDMLRYSTNLTAEIVGLRASQARGVDPVDIAASAAEMTAWARETYGLEDAFFVNHSGLSDLSLWSPVETVRFLQAEAGRLPELMRQRPILDRNGDVFVADGVQVLAKTGTLYFSSGLAGYLEGRGRMMAFAVYSVDPEKRLTIDPNSDGRPFGSRGWTGRARGLQNGLLRAWVMEYMPEPPMRPLPRPLTQQAEAAQVL